MGYFVYKHTSPSGKIYIGITRNKPEWRWNHGKGYCRGDQPLFERAIIKYGWDNIKHEILFSDLSEETAKLVEIALIRYYKSFGLSYNISDGGDGALGNRSHLGQKASSATKAKMSYSHKGKCTGKGNFWYGKHETAPTCGKYGRMHPASKEVYQYSLSGELIKKWSCLSDVQRELGIIVTNITAVCRGRSFTVGGFRWSYNYPYVFNPEEEIRKKNKREKLSKIAIEGYRTGRRKALLGDENPMSKKSKSVRQDRLDERNKSNNK